MLIETVDHARPLIPRCLAEVPGSPSDYDIYMALLLALLNQTVVGTRRWKWWRS